MKQVFFIALMSFVATGSVFANPLICTENTNRLGYRIHFSAAMNSAVVAKYTRIGPKVVANLTCMRSPAPPSAMPSQDYVLVTCFEPNLRDAGYSVVVRANSGNGSVKAILSEVSFVGSRPIAELACQ